MVVLHCARCGGHADNCADRIAVAPVAGEQRLKPMLPPVRYVSQQLGRFVEAGNHYVHSSVVVKIAERATTRRRRLGCLGANTRTSMHKTSTPGVGKN